MKLNVSEYLFDPARKDEYYRLEENEAVAVMNSGGDNRTCMILPATTPNAIQTITIWLEKSSEGACLIGVGTKDVDPRYYLGHNESGISFYFKSDGTSVIEGRTSS